MVSNSAMSKNWTFKHREKRKCYETDVLEYWKTNKIRFLILTRMAIDYLALQPTSKDVEGTFSKARRTILYFRRSQTACKLWVHFGPFLEDNI